MPSSSKNEETIIKDISDLQNMERDLFSSLETNTSLTKEQQDKILEQISKLSAMRGNLYKTLYDMNKFYENALETSVDTLTEQVEAIGIVEKELNTAKQRLNMLQSNKNDKIRLVEINDYYGNKYTEHSNFMKIIIYTLIPVIILTVLNKHYILPNNIFYVLVIIVAAIGAVIGWNAFFSIIRRNNMNYQTYDWYFNPSTAPPPPSNVDLTDPWVTDSTTETCIGADCCSSTQTFDPNTNLCVSSTCAESFELLGVEEAALYNHHYNNSTGGSSLKNDPSVTESMIESCLIKQANDKYKPDVHLEAAEPNSVYSPYSSYL